MAFLCPICTENNYPISIGCSHTICDQCYPKLESQLCPLCRHNILPSDIKPNVDLIDQFNIEKKNEDFWDNLWIKNLIAKISPIITDRTLGVYYNFGTGVGEVNNMMTQIAENVDSEILLNRKEDWSYSDFFSGLLLSLDGLYLLIQTDDSEWDIDRIRLFIIKLIYAKINRECSLELE